MSVTVDTLHDRGRAALLEGRPTLDLPPTAGSRRWGLSVVVRPGAGLADRLAAETADLVALAGADQWATGSTGSAHLTIFSLEPHRPGVTLADPAARHFADATERAASVAGPATFAVTGLGLTPGGVIASCEPADDAARALRPALAAALGGDVFELAYRGEQWWMSLLHLAAPVARPSALVDHVEARRTEMLGDLTVATLELVRYDHHTGPAGSRMVPITLASTALTSEPGEVLHGPQA